MTNFIIGYLLVSLVAFIGSGKEIIKCDGWFGAIYLCLFPIVNFFIALMGLPNIARTIIKPFPFCFGLHKGPVVYSSEQEKWRDGRRPLRISMGGYTKHKCSKCTTEWTEHWSAF